LVVIPEGDLLLAVAVAVAVVVAVVVAFRPGLAWGFSPTNRGHKKIHGTLAPGRFLAIAKMPATNCIQTTYAEQKINFAFLAQNRAVKPKIVLSLTKQSRCAWRIGSLELARIELEMKKAPGIEPRGFFLFLLTRLERRF
jgi:hypothetical protein